MLLVKWQVGICTSTYEEYFLSGTIPDLCESHDFNTVSNKEVVQNRIQTEQDVIIEEPEPQANTVETPLPQAPAETDSQNNQEIEEQDFSSQNTNNKPTENAVTNNVNTGNSLDNTRKKLSEICQKVLTKVAKSHILYTQGETCIVLGIEKIPQ